MINSQNSPTKYLICIVGASGSGKDTLVQEICKVPIFSRTDNSIPPKYLKQIISYTTRPKRKNEENTHIFVNPSDFPPEKERLAYTKYQNYEYCATIEQGNSSDIYIIDPNGLETLQNHPALESKIFSLYLQVPWYTRLKRITKRNNIFYAIKRVWKDRAIFKNFEYVADATRKNKTRKELYENCNLILDIVEKKDYIVPKFLT